VPFDPFSDFDSRGYLRNIAGEKDLEIVRRLEHVSFTTGLDEVLKQLSEIKLLTYQNVLNTHKTLFEAVYSWAGEDRAHNAPELAVSRGGILFAHPKDIRRAVEVALTKGQSGDIMRQKPGEVMGYLAFAHPFLEGNGRTIMVVHSMLAQRAGISIDWAATDKSAYLSALAQEIDNPGKGTLDNYLKPFIRTVIAEHQLARHIKDVPGLSGATDNLDSEDMILGKVTEPTVQERYTAHRIQRERSQDGGSKP
jgi:cell filamentation protein